MHPVSISVVSVKLITSNALIFKLTSDEQFSNIPLNVPTLLPSSISGTNDAIILPVFNFTLSITVEFVVLPNVTFVRAEQL